MKNDPALGRIGRRLLRHEAGSETEPMRLAAAGEAALQKLRAHLVPLIGHKGFRALLNYARHHSARQHPLLGGITFIGQEEALLGGLPESVLGWDAAAVDNAFAALIGCLIGLLVDFLGTDLATRIVEGIWPNVLGDEGIL